jgi:hypothetical protein
MVYGAIACMTTTALAGPPCGDGINNLYTWDGGGTNNSWNNAANWSPDGVPDCDDDVLFNATSYKWCYITSAVQVRDFSLLGTWRGRIYVRGTSSLSLRNMVMQGGMIICSDTSGTFRANNVLMGYDAYLGVKTAVITGTLTLNNSIYAVRSLGYSDIMNLTLNNFAKFSAPDGFQKGGPPSGGVTYIRGNLTRQPLGLFMHDKGLVRFCGNTDGTINTNNTLMNFWNIEIDKKTDGGGDTTAPAHLYANASTNDRIFALNRLSLMEASLTGWSEDDWVAGGDSVIVENTMANNDNLHTFSNNGHVTLAFLGSGNGRYFHKTFLSGTYNVRIEKGNNTDLVTVVGLQDIGHPLHTVHVVKGRLKFSNTGNARIRASTSSGLHVLANGQVIAPENDTLFFSGCWNFANSNSFDPRNGVVNLDGTGNRLTFTHNGDTIFFNELVITVTNGGTQGVLNWTTTAGIIYVRGDFKITSADAYINNARLLLEGDLISLQTTPNSGTKLTEQLVFLGGNNQTVNLSSAAKFAYRHQVELAKTAGSVTLASDMDIRTATFTDGVLNTSGYILTLTLPTNIFGGDANSYINGPVTITDGGVTWPASAKIPVGKSASYNPLYIRNASSGNSYTVEYFNSGYSGTNTVNAPIDAVSTTEYWQVDRLAGATAYDVSLPTTNAPGGWSATDIRVAGNDGSGWNNLGPAGGASGGLVTSTTGTTSSTRYFTLGVDNASPIVLTQEGISGKELQTERYSRSDVQDAGMTMPQMMIFPNPVQNRFAISLKNATSGVVSITDLNGRMLFTGNAQSTQWVDCSSWSSGIYLVRFTDGINSITRRISVSY